MEVSKTYSPMTPGRAIRRAHTGSTAIVFGHADADGHVAAEQTRTNLVAQGVHVSAVIVSAETRNYRFWDRTFIDWDFSRYDVVVAVDIAFSFREPVSSLDALLTVVDDHPTTEFIVVDHHPLARPRRRRGNLSLIEVQDPYDCCLGQPSEELMAIAALCDGGLTSVKANPETKRRALGIRRAAADVGGVAGATLLKLLAGRRWDFFEALADEDPELHRSVRGRRRSGNAPSPLLRSATGRSLSSRTKSQLARRR